VTPLKILHIGKYFPPHAGGMETYLRDAMADLARRGVAPVALVHHSALSLKSSDELCPSTAGPLPVTRAAVWARLLFTPFSPTFPWLLRRLLREQRPDILHFHTPNASAFWALLLPAARRIPWVIQWQADVLASRHSAGLRLFYRLYRPLERALLRRSRRIIVSSPPYLRSSAPLAPYHHKCVVVPLGLDPAALAVPAVPAVPPAGRNRSSLRVLAIGRLTYYKGFEYLLRAVALAPAAHLHLVGSGDLEQALRRLAGELGIRERVTFHGHLPEEGVAAQYAACDCLCLPSIERTEAFGLVLLEAMYFGKATVISDVPGSGMGWIVDHEVTGIKVPAADAAALAGALRQLQANRDTLARLGENGRRKFDQQFHIHQATAAITGIYAEILGTGRATVQG
jgi:glycosyltransferase involved in cell wall biosynthesis